MDFDDYLIDAQLHIKTTGRDDSCADDLCSPYEPTSYSVLARLAESGYVTGKNHLVDYGSGLGRVPIYLADKTGCHAIGVEMMRWFHEKALRNLESYLDGRENAAIDFYNQKAQDFVLPDEADLLFFFNPFHSRTFKSVMTNVIASYRKAPRRIRLFFYYPHDSYIAFLSSVPEVMFFDEIDCTDLFREEDDRNRIMIFEMEP